MKTGTELSDHEVTVEAQEGLLVMRRAPRPENPLVTAAKECLAVSVSEQLDALRLAEGLSIDRFAKMAELSPQTVLDALKTATDWRLTTLVKCALATGHNVRIAFEPMPRRPSAL